MPSKPVRFSFLCWRIPPAATEASASCSRACLWHRCPKNFRNIISLGSIMIVRLQLRTQNTGIGSQIFLLQIPRKSQNKDFPFKIKSYPRPRTWRRRLLPCLTESLTLLHAMPRRCTRKSSQHVEPMRRLEARSLSWCLDSTRGDDLTSRPEIRPYQQKLT